MYRLNKNSLGTFLVIFSLKRQIERERKRVSIKGGFVAA